MSTNLKNIFVRSVYRRTNKLEPVSRRFGFDRGTPIDRYYIDKFLADNSAVIVEDILEIGGTEYAQRYASKINSVDSLEYSTFPRVKNDLTLHKSLSDKKYNVVICTQVLNFIYDVELAIGGIIHLLKNNGTALITVGGISQISNYDAQRWGDYWRFTSFSLHKLLSKFPACSDISVQAYGNVFAATEFLYGSCAEELKTNELDYLDDAYQIVVAAKFTKYLGKI